MLALRGSLGNARPDLRLCSLAGVLDSLANFAFLLAVREGDARGRRGDHRALSRLDAGARPPVLHERVSGAQAAGLGVAATAVVLLALA